MVEAFPPRPPTSDPVAPSASPGFTRTRNAGGSTYGSDATYVQEMEDEFPPGPHDPEAPYNYDHLQIPDIALRPSFNPWSSSRARIY
jgi:hypothetical protein